MKKVQYVTSGLFHGYDKQGLPGLVPEAEASEFENKEHAQTMIAHDLDQYGFDGGAFRLV